jgi:hypothetical protein
MIWIKSRFDGRISKIVVRVNYQQNFVQEFHNCGCILFLLLLDPESPFNTASLLGGIALIVLLLLQSKNCRKAFDGRIAHKQWSNNVCICWARAPLHWWFHYENISSLRKINGIFMHTWQRIIYPGVPEFETGSMIHRGVRHVPRAYSTTRISLFPWTWFVVWMARCRRRWKPRKSLASWLDCLLSTK